MVTKLLDASSYIELSLFECGRERCIPEKEFDFTVKTYHLVHYVAAGKGNLWISGKLYRLHRGDIFYVPPGCHPHYTPDHDDPWTYLWLGFDGSNAKAYLQMMRLSEENPVLHDDEHRYKEFFDAIYNEYISKGYFDLFCLGQAYALFGALCENAPGQTGNLSLTEGHIKAAKEFILNNFQFRITVEDIAHNVGVTSNYLANIFAKYEHSSPKKYLTEVRMKNATIFLKTGVYRVNEVGRKVGYQNQLHFSNEFKKHFGTSPINYLKGASTK
jgi:AraC-like DNA-binding protein